MINNDIVPQENSQYKIEECVNIMKERMKNMDKKVLNRRKKKLEEMLSSTNNEYFSEEAIQHRDPILYEIYVGSHKRRNTIFDSNLNLINGNEQTSVTKFLMNELDSEIHKANLKQEINKEAGQYGMNMINEIYCELESVNSEANNLLEDEQDELIRLMSLRFLMGEDKDFFNYEEVDNNELYDDVEQINRDLEEAYFDEEQPNQVQASEYNGEQDY